MINDYADVTKQVQENIKLSQDTQSKYYDLKRVDVEFKVGDFVLLDTNALPSWSHS